MYPTMNQNNHHPHAPHAEEEYSATGEDEEQASNHHEGTNPDTTAEETSDEDDDEDDDDNSRVAQMRACTEARDKANEGINSNSNSLFQKYRVVGHSGCQVRETEAMDSKPVFLLKRGTIVSVLKSTVPDKYDILSRRVLVNHTSEESGKVIKGWASIQSSQGYGILSPNSDDDDDDNSNDDEDDDDTAAAADDDDDDEDDSDEDDDDEEEEDDSNDDGSSDEEDVPTPEEVELEYTYPQDFVGRSWEYVVGRDAVTGRHRFFRLRIDPSCTKIELWAFVNCKFLIEIVFAENCGLTEIGRGAFDGCTNLQRMNPFPTGLLRLLRDAFRCCRSLSGDLVIPCTVVLVEFGCFRHCAALTSVVFQPSFTPEHNILSLLSSCFEGCTSLVNISLPNTVQEFRACAFKGCTSLTMMDFPQSCVYFGWEALRECTALHTITIRAPSNDVRIERGFLQGCASSLTTIQCHPWIWSKILYSMNDDTTFLTKFVSGTLTLLSSINIYSWYGSQMFEVMNDQPNAMYQILREFQHQIFDTQNNNTMETEEIEEEAAAASTVQTNEQQQKRPRLL